MRTKRSILPWRLPRPEDQLKTSYVGIGCYRDLSGQRLLTSTAQMFDERGKGLILRAVVQGSTKAIAIPTLTGKMLITCSAARLRRTSTSTTTTPPE